MASASMAALPVAAASVAAAPTGGCFGLCYNLRSCSVKHCCSRGGFRGCYSLGCYSCSSSDDHMTSAAVASPPVTAHVAFVAGAASPVAAVPVAAAPLLFAVPVVASPADFCLKVHKIEIFFGFDFEICIISLLVMSKY
jgi:hypothetical protein